jgi:hypothetical protein
LDFLKPAQKLRVSLRVSGLAHAEGLQIPSWNFHRVSQRETRPRLARRESDELFAMEKFQGYEIGKVMGSISVHKKFIRKTFCALEPIGDN